MTVASSDATESLRPSNPKGAVASGMSRDAAVMSASDRRPATIFCSDGATRSDAVAFPERGGVSDGRSGESFDRSGTETTTENGAPVSGPLRSRLATSAAAWSAATPSRRSSPSSETGRSRKESVPVTRARSCEATSAPIVTRSMETGPTGRSRSTLRSAMRGSAGNASESEGFRRSRIPGRSANPSDTATEETGSPPRSRRSRSTRRRRRPTVATTTSPERMRRSRIRYPTIGFPDTDATSHRPFMLPETAFNSSERTISVPMSIPWNRA